MKKILLATVAIIGMTTSSFAACTQADIQKKMTDMTTKLQEVLTKDPSKAQKWQQKSVEMMQKAQTITNEDEACAYFDQLQKEIEADL